MFYETVGKLELKDISDLHNYVRDAAGGNYVYLLCYPPHATRVRPFYVGIGQGDRVFAHENEAAKATSSGQKVDIIRQIQATGQQVLRYIDGVFPEMPWRREQELIDRFGLLKDGSGTLANEQRYAQSALKNGIELRKYAAEGNALPSNFIRRNARLVVGPRQPKSRRSVYGKIYSILETNPGVTGAALVELLLSVDFSGNATVYAQDGQVSRPWLAKYIDGGFYAKNQCIAEI